MTSRASTVSRYLVAGVWPAAESAVAAATVVAARRASGRKARRGLSRLRARGRSADPVGPVHGAAELAGFSALAGLMPYGVMTLIGPTVVGHGPALDEPLLCWLDQHRVGWWAAIMTRLGKIGDTWTTWGAAGTAGVCLAVTWPRQKWLPPAVLAAALLVDHYTTIALRRRFGRPGPPSSPLGTYPSGGCDRVVLFYGLIGYLLWREFSGSDPAKAWTVGTVAALSVNEVYSRTYLGKHWFTDSVTGVLYGGLLLAPFVAAVRRIAGPPVAPRQVL